MDMTGQYRIPAPRERVWAALNDPDILAASIPGCQSLERVSPTEMSARVTAKIGPVKANFAGRVRLSDLNPPEGYRIVGEGQGGVAGFAKGGAEVHLAPDGADATVLTYRAQASVGGKLAQLGARLIDSTAKAMAEQFFARFSALAAGEPLAAAPSLPISPATEIAREEAAGPVGDGVAAAELPPDEAPTAPPAAVPPSAMRPSPVPPSATAPAGMPAPEAVLGPAAPPGAAAAPPAAAAPVTATTPGSAPLPRPRREIPRWVWLAAAAVVALIVVAALR